MGCKKPGQNVDCTFLVTSTNKDTVFWIYGQNVRMIDVSGNEYKTRNSSFTKDLIQNIPLKFTLTSNKLPLNLDNVSILEVAAKGGRFQLRNVTFSL